MYWITRGENGKLKLEHALNKPENTVSGPYKNWKDAHLAFCVYSDEEAFWQEDRDAWIDEL
jgi:hypothetical protein